MNKQFMDLAYRRIRSDEIEFVHDILRQCGQDMKARLGLGHWDPPYPLHLLHRAAEERRMYVVLDGEQIVATFTLGSEPPTYYRAIPGIQDAWNPLGEPAIYVNRLAILPAWQGQGIGTWCMHQIESLVYQEGYQAIRLDAYDRHVQLIGWYQSLGYQRRGAFTFHTKIYGETGLVCLEKIKDG